MPGCRSFPAVLMLVLAAPAAGVAAPPNPGSDAAAVKFFEDRVRPVLAGRCQSCHGPDKQKSGLRVDSRAALLHGGERGPALVPGQPGDSLLLQAVSHRDGLAMPPSGKLPAGEVADLAAWIKVGAPWPAHDSIARGGAGGGTGVTDKDREFWAFRKPAAGVLPAAVDPAWEQSPVDRFIRGGLAARGLKPAPPADRRTLLRRVTFDLTGLPPAPEEVEAFVRDSAPDAFARAVDRLLASPAFGERWGRRWLDVARYADSNGMDENLAMGNAWRYRDWVIAAFNADKPYDQFVREQIAGDLLGGDPDRAAERLTATGFLCIGPKMLAEDDPVKMEMDIIDEQVDTVGRTFLGLTLGCARCHDHKFDPVPMADYYGLAGMFKSTKTMDHFKVVARWQERPAGNRAEVDRQKRYDEATAARQAELDGVVKRAGEAMVAGEKGRAAEYVAAAVEVRRAGPAKPLVSVLGGPAGERPAGTIVVEAEDYARGNAKKEHTGYGEGIGVIYNAGPLPNVAEYDVAVPRAGPWQIELRWAAAEARPVRLLVSGKVAQGQAAGRVTGSWFPDTQTWGAEALVVLPAGRVTVRLERDGPFPHLDKLALVPRPGAVVPRTAEQVAAERGLNPAFLAAWVRRLEAGPAPEGEALRRAADEPQGPFALPKNAEEFFPAATRAEVQHRREELATRAKGRPVLPEVMAVGDGAAGNLRIHLRGSHLKLGAEAPRRFPRVLDEGSPVAIPAGESGRRQLAEWLTRPDHPLTARVMVNRLWRGLFGAGLVRSVDNFGRLGEPPSHPELLDWLAVRFVAEGWSVKRMLRLMVLSSTYQMSSAHDERAALVDPDNRLLWRHARRRLEAEEVRDGLLAVSGRLDRTAGGTLYAGANRAYVVGYPNTTYDRYDFPRRSVYLPVIRSDTYAVLQAFDFPDPSTPSGDRATTTVAPQALFLLNGKLAQEAARRLADRLLAEPGADDAGRVGLAYARSYGRPPRPPEIARALGFVRQCEEALAAEKVDPAEARRRAWQGLAQVVLASSEFVTVE